MDLKTDADLSRELREGVQNAALSSPDRALTTLTAAVERVAGALEKRTVDPRGGFDDGYRAGQHDALEQLAGPTPGTEESKDP